MIEWKKRLREEIFEDSESPKNDGCITYLVTVYFCIINYKKVGLTKCKQKFWGLRSLVATVWKFLSSINVNAKKLGGLET